MTLHLTSKGVGESLGVRLLGLDLHLCVGIEVHVDSAAAIGICRRSGVGRARHLAVGQLWAQETLRAGCCFLHKVVGVSNLADLLTKY